MKKVGIGGSYISSRQTMKSFRDAYHSSTIFPRLSLEKWQESDHPDAMKFLRQRTLDLINISNYPADQFEILQKGEYLVEHQQLLSRQYN